MVSKLKRTTLAAVAVTGLLVLPAASATMVNNSPVRATIGGYDWVNVRPGNGEGVTHLCLPLVIQKASAYELCVAEGFRTQNVGKRMYRASNEWRLFADEIYVAPRPIVGLSLAGQQQYNQLGALLQAAKDDRDQIAAILQDLQDQNGTFGTLVKDVAALKETVAEHTTKLENHDNRLKAIETGPASKLNQADVDWIKGRPPVTGNGSVLPQWLTTWWPVIVFGLFLLGLLVWLLSKRNKDSAEDKKPQQSQPAQPKSERKGVMARLPRRNNQGPKVPSTKAGPLQTSPNQRIDVLVGDFKKLEEKVDDPETGLKKAHEKGDAAHESAKAVGEQTEQMRERFDTFEPRLDRVEVVAGAALTQASPLKFERTADLTALNKTATSEWVLVDTLTGERYEVPFTKNDEGLIEAPILRRKGQRQLIQPFKPKSVEKTEEILRIAHGSGRLKPCLVESKAA